MAAIFADSFDHYAFADINEKWTQTIAGSGDSSTVTTVGRRSTQGLRISQSGASNRSSAGFAVVPAMPAPSGATCIQGFAFRCVTAFTVTTGATQPDNFGLNCSSVITCIRKSSSTLIWFRLNSNGTISAYVGSTLLGTTAAALSQNVYQYLEFKVLLSATVGTVEVRIDGVAQLALTGQNTGGTSWDEVRLGPNGNGNVGSNPTEWDYDDLYVLDGTGSTANNFLNDTRIDVVRPDANGTNRAWTPSTGTDDFAVEDETLANGDTDYLETAGIGDKVTMNYPNAPVSGATINFIQIVAQTRKTDAGAAGHKSITRLSGTDYLGTERAPSATYSFLRELQSVNPMDSTAWTSALFNGAEFGAQKSS